MEIDYVIPPKTTQRVKAVLLDHYFGNYEDAECVMVSRTATYFALRYIKPVKKCTYYSTLHFPSKLLFLLFVMPALHLANFDTDI